MSSANAIAANSNEVRSVPVGSTLYNEIVEFLYREAALLDHMRFAEWADLLTEDLSYTAPLRQTRALADQKNAIVRTTKHFDDNYGSIMGRIGRLTNTKSAWAEDPPSRTRRFVSNILVDATAKPDEYAVTSYLLLTRSRFEETSYHFVSAERHDVLRRVGNNFKLAKREILIDQSVLGIPNLAVFL